MTLARTHQGIAEVHLIEMINVKRRLIFSFGIDGGRGITSKLEDVANLTRNELDQFTLSSCLGRVDALHPAFQTISLSSPVLLLSSFPLLSSYPSSFILVCSVLRL